MRVSACLICAKSKPPTASVFVPLPEVSRIISIRHKAFMSHGVEEKEEELEIEDLKRTSLALGQRY